ncbi:MAG: ketoacyl-ACP synthase III [Candidatus Zixiibacteriota bacterium]|nr:MAG: ketoacyl-ACP synthase III [candidate division Zixibacteria bacterium]
MRAKIIGTGSYTPPRRMTNADFEKIVDTSDEWIVSRTGIRERRIADSDTHCSDMSVIASRQALEMAGCSSKEIDLIVVATVTPDYRLPSTACVVQEKLGLPNATGFDVAAACAGFINGLSLVGSLVETGRYKKALVIGTEKLSAFTNYRDRNTCVLFGDAAGAVVVTAQEGESGIVSTFLKSDGRMREMLWAEVGGTVNPYTTDYTYDGRDKIMMNGSDVFKVAVREMCRAAEKVLAEAGISSEEVALVVPHQANIRIIEALAKRLKLGMDKFYINIDRYGNTSSASVPLALDQANRDGVIKSGDYVLMAAFGGGLVWGSALVRW